MRALAQQFNHKLFLYETYKFHSVCFYSKLDKNVALVQADNVNFKNKDGEEYLLLSKDNMEANVHLLNLKGM